MNKKDYKSPEFSVNPVRIKPLLLAETVRKSVGLGTEGDEAESKTGSTIWSSMDDDDDDK